MSGAKRKACSFSGLAMRGREIMKAIDLFNQAGEKFEKIHDLWEIGMVSEGLGYCYRSLGQCKKAWKFTGNTWTCATKPIIHMEYSPPILNWQSTR